MGVRTANVQDGNIGETLTGLAEVIHGRRDASPQESYTARLLTDVACRGGKRGDHGLQG